MIVPDAVMGTAVSKPVWQAVGEVNCAGRSVRTGPCRMCTGPPNGHAVVEVPIGVGEGVGDGVGVGVDCIAVVAHAGADRNEVPYWLYAATDVQYMVRGNNPVSV